MIRKEYAIIFFLLIMVGVGSSFLHSDNNFHHLIPPQFTDKSLFLTAIRNSSTEPYEGKVYGITVPHHLLVPNLIADAFLFASKNDYERIILISPDHFSLGDTPISVAVDDFSTVFGDLKTDRAFVDKLKKEASASSFFYREHGVQSELPFIKYFFPEAKIVTIALKQTGKDTLDILIAILMENIDERTLIVQSTDFSHYLPVEMANIKDRETIAVLERGDPEDLFSLDQPDHLDSIAAQYIQMRIQREVFKSQLKILTHENSQKYTDEDLDSTTSYIVQVYTD